MMLVVDHAVDGPNAALFLVTAQTTQLSLVVNLRELEIATGDQFVWVLFGTGALDVRGYFRIERKA